MFDTHGENFPTMNVSIDHVFKNTKTGGVYRYIGGDVTDTDRNWILIDGELATDPDTSLWTVRQAGAKWYNTTQQNFKGWDGAQIVLRG